MLFYRKVENMNEVERQELKNRIEGMSEEETLLAVKVIPTDVLWDELRRRDNLNREMITNARQILKVVE
jgi:hypothetical protein